MHMCIFDEKGCYDAEHDLLATAKLLVFVADIHRVLCSCWWHKRYVGFLFSTVLLMEYSRSDWQHFLKCIIELEGTRWSVCTSDKVVPTARGE